MWNPFKKNKIAKQISRNRSNAVTSPVYETENPFTEEMQQAGLDRGVEFLSSIQADWTSIGMSAVGKAVSISASQLMSSSEPESSNAIERASSEVNELIKDGMSAASQAIPHNKKLSEIKDFLNVIWNKIQIKISQSPKIKKALDVLKIGVDVLLGQLRDLILSAEVLKTLIPFYGAIKGGIDTIKGVMDTKSHQNNWENLKKTSGSFADGIPSVAIKSFMEYVQKQKMIEGAKTTYTGAKTLCSLLLQVCTMGASSVFDLVSKIVEAVSSFAYSMYETFMVVSFTKKCKECVTDNRSITDEEFRDMCAGAPLISCIFLGISTYIQPHCLAALFYSGKKTINASEFSVACLNLLTAKSLAWDYYRKSPVKLTTARPDFVWLVDMLSGKRSDFSPPPARPRSNAIVA